MSRVKPKPSWLTPEVRRHLRRIFYRFQVRKFGEEMAWVNRLPYDQRRAYINHMIDYAKSKGVSFEKPAEGVTR